MAIQKFNLRSLSMLDGGRISAAVDQAIARCREDCGDRPHEEAARKVVLTMEFKPQPDDRGQLDSIDVACDVVDSQPKRRSKVYNMRVSGQSMLFDELSPDDAKQGTLPVDAAAGKKVGA